MSLSLATISQKKNTWCQGQIPLLEMEGWEPLQLSHSGGIPRNYPLPSGKLTWQWKMDQLKMYSLLKMVIFQPAMLVYWRVLSTEKSLYFSPPDYFHLFPVFTCDVNYMYFTSILSFLKCDVFSQHPTFLLIVVVTSIPYQIKTIYLKKRRRIFRKSNKNQWILESNPQRFPKPKPPDPSLPLALALGQSYPLEVVPCRATTAWDFMAGWKWLEDHEYIFGLPPGPQDAIVTNEGF